MTGTELKGYQEWKIRPSPNSRGANGLPGASVRLSANSRDKSEEGEIKLHSMMTLLLPCLDPLILSLVTLGAQTSLRNPPFPGFSIVTCRRPPVIPTGTDHPFLPTFLQPTFPSLYSKPAGFSPSRFLREGSGSTQV